MSRSRGKNVVITHLQLLYHDLEEVYDSRSKALTVEKFANRTHRHFYSIFETKIKISMRDVQREYFSINIKLFY
jgi:predicted ATPase